MDHVDDSFEWDVAKSDDCLRRRGFDIDQRDYGDEERDICVGEIDERYFTVVYTPRGSRKRIISAWLADKAEVRKYVEYCEAAK